jgi:hypothetical protein
VDGCDLLAELGEPGLCRSHRVRWGSQGRPGLAEFLFCCAIYGEPRFDLRGLTAQARLEIGYVLQCRVDERRRPHDAGLLRCAKPGQARSLIPVGQIARVSSSKAVKTRRFATSWIPSS